MTVPLPTTTLTIRSADWMYQSNQYSNTEQAHPYNMCMFHHTTVNIKTFPNISNAKKIKYKASFASELRKNRIKNIKTHSVIEYLNTWLISPWKMAEQLSQIIQDCEMICWLMIEWLLRCVYSCFYKHFYSTCRRPISGTVTLILTSLWLFFELVFPESTSEGSCPHMQGCSGWEGEKEEEGDLETKPIHHASRQSAKHQLPQHLQSCKKTVMSCLKGKHIEQRWMIRKERKVRGAKVKKRWYWKQSVSKRR